MALSPWKRLFRMMSQRPPAEQVQAAVSDDRHKDGDVIDTSDVAFVKSLVEDETKPGLEPLSDGPERVLQTDDLEVERAVEAVGVLSADHQPAAPQDEVQDHQQVEITPQLPNGGLDNLAATAPRRREKRARQVLPADDERAQPLPPNAIRSPYAEMISMDEEIKELRTQLSIKLSRQNAQLKQMLKRFEPR